MAPLISEAEAQVLQALVEMEEATARELYAVLAESTGWAQPTVVTFLRRLEAKGLVSHSKEKGQRAFLYRPNQRGRSAGREQVKNLVNRVFGGNPVPLMSMFVEEEALTKEQITALRQLLDEQEKKKGGRV
ncbi:MAG: BlaI/MecI/CopY family transcriptional regulator [Candidatus Hydrogenedentes bacterium]|nr:BlaI/MecI/CopY family transcriptional regulator [Candidatus Hydrogenedentota bacterium]